MAAIDFPNSPTDGQLFVAPNGVTYIFSAAPAPGYWRSQGGGSVIFVGATAPTSPVVGMLWWNSELGQLFLYYNDGNSSQWVPASPLYGGYTGAGDFYATAYNVGVGTAAATYIFPTVVTGNRGGWYSTSTGRWMPPPGRYYVFATVVTGANGAASVVETILRKNGNVIVNGGQVPGTAGWWGDPSVAAVLDMNGTDWCDIQAFSSGAGGSMANFYAWFGAFPITGIKGPPGDPGPTGSALGLYSEQVLAANAASMSVTFPANARKVEIEYFCANVGPANDVLSFRAMLNGAPNTSAAYNSQSVIGSVTTPSASQSLGATAWSGGNQAEAKGTIRPGLSATQPFIEHTQFLSSTTQVFSILWGYSGTAGAGMNGMQMFNSGGTQFLPGSFMRSYVVQ